MQDLFRFIITVLTIYLVYTFLFYAIKRIQAIFKLSELKKNCGAKITYTRVPFSSYLKLSSKPDITVEIGNTVYLIRLINGKGSLRFVHFASKEFFVTFSKIRISVGALLRIGPRSRATSSESTSRQSVKILPALQIPKQYTESNVQTVPVLMFNPAPNEITFVSEAKTSIKAAFEGDNMYGQMVFTPSAFVSYADRVYREQARNKEEDLFWI